MSGQTVSPPFRHWLARCCPKTLKGKQMAVMVGLFVGFIWALTLIAATVLRSQLEQLLSDQQFAIARHVATELDVKLRERMRSLAELAERLPTSLDPETLDSFLPRHFPQHFLGGVAVIGPDGIAIADYPAVPGRRGTYFGDRDYFRQAVAARRPYIGKPIQGRTLHRPVLAIGMPILNPDGSLRAVLSGITDLTDPNFLGIIADPSLPGGSELAVASARDRTIVASSVAGQTLAAMPEVGAHAMYDRFSNGFEGSGIAADAGGVPKLYSGKQVPSAGWTVVAALPTDVVFRPVQVMQRYLYAIATLFTVLAVLIVGWTTRRSLAPLEEAGESLRQMTAGLSPLPIRRDDEIGQLLRSFNRLLEDRQRHEAALAESQGDLAFSRQRLRELSAHNESRLEEERRSIAREIHDELGQLLTALKMECSLLCRTYPDDPLLQAKVEGMRSLLDSTIGVARHIVSNLRPPALDHGIIPAIEWQAEDFSLRWEIPCALELDADDVLLDDARATTLFRIVQESLTNVARHAKATQVSVSLRREGATLQLCVRDDGQGFDPALVATKPGFGLQGMRERAISFDGTMRISSAPGAGTAVTVEIPL